ncbi:hypothetical protein [Aurantimonas sp. VKM B-3413]|uniref:hypothetical protein n=1 Tax=Aurantimonas sp. VKM B-3413 TaxID=2779401 RepID=UPI001E58BE69|nr:hypothetical protein [Aurantimonas sp. VKM B-3413]MCB8837391.1 hypothetical protein [Aurantimonas sp. VKM B-3413]
MDSQQAFIAVGSAVGMPVFAHTGHRGRALAAGSTFSITDGALAEAGEPRCPLSHDGRDGVGFVLQTFDTCSWVLSIMAPPGEGRSYIPTINAFLRRLGRQMQEAFLVSHGVGTRHQPDREVIEGTWDRLDMPVMLLGSELQPQAMNVAAEELATTRRFFAPRAANGSLRAASNRDNERLLEAAFQVRCGERKEARLTLNGVRGSAGLRVSIFATGSRSAETAERDLVAVFGTVA